MEEMNPKKELISLMVLFFLSIATSFGLYQCKKTSNTSGTSGGQTPPAHEVWIQNNGFNPSSITIPANTTITWTNKDGMAHTVTSTAGSFDSGSIGSGGTYSFKFMTIGTFPYKCSFHSNMTGTVIVQ